MALSTPPNRVVLAPHRNLGAPPLPERYHAGLAATKDVDSHRLAHVEHLHLSRLADRRRLQHDRDDAEPFDALC